MTRMLSFVSAMSFRRARESTDADTADMESRRPLSEPSREVLRLSGATGINGSALCDDASGSAIPRDRG